MTTPRDAGHVVIVGAGLAGYSAADQLRTLGHDGRITVIDPEPVPYDRPPLSKRLFDDDFTLERLAFTTGHKLAERRIDTALGRRVVAIDTVDLSVRVDDGRTIRSDTILLATGGRARTLPVPGNDLDGVFLLRTFDDAVALQQRARHSSRAVVVGAGLIGAELASALRLAGVETTLIDPVPTPLVPAVGDILAGILHGMHSDNGVHVITADTREIVENPDGGLTVVLEDGTRIDTDFVVVGVGLVPNVEIASEAGLDVDNGILVDEFHRTSAPGIYAAGDVARRRLSDGSLQRREEHWDAAQASGRDAAHGMLGLDAPERSASWFWSDRHGVHLEATGRLTGSGDLVVREGATHPAVFLVDGDVLAGAAAIDDNQTIRAARRLIDLRAPVTAADLANPDVSLRGLLRAAR